MAPGHPGQRIQKYMRLSAAIGAGPGQGYDVELQTSVDGDTWETVPGTRGRVQRFRWPGGLLFNLISAPFAAAGCGWVLGTTGETWLLLGVFGLALLWAACLMAVVKSAIASARRERPAELPLPVSIHPIESLRMIAREVAAAEGLEVDEASFDQARAYTDAPATPEDIAESKADFVCCRNCGSVRALHVPTLPAGCPGFEAVE